MYLLFLCSFWHLMTATNKQGSACSCLSDKPLDSISFWSWWKLMNGLRIRKCLDCQVLEHKLKPSLDCWARMKSTVRNKMVDRCLVRGDMMVNGIRVRQQFKSGPTFTQSIFARNEFSMTKIQSCLWIKPWFGSLKILSCQIVDNSARHKPPQKLNHD